MSNQQTLAIGVIVALTVTGYLLGWRTFNLKGAIEALTQPKNTADIAVAGLTLYAILTIAGLGVTVAGFILPTLSTVATTIIGLTMIAIFLSTMNGSSPSVPPATGKAKTAALSLPQELTGIAYTFLLLITVVFHTYINGTLVLGN